MNFKLIEKHIPYNSLHHIENWIGNERVLLKIKSARRTKLGDYRFIKETNLHQITVDGTLEPEVFFFVLTHELAHMLVRIKFSEKVKSHGNEWKQVFGQLLRESLNVYPEELKPIIFGHAQNPRASVGADKRLYQKLFVDSDKLEMLVENLTDNQKFRIGKRVFIKGVKRKIRYICKEVRTGKQYLISGQAIVDEIINK